MLISDITDFCERSYKEDNPLISDRRFDVQGFWEFRDINLWICFRGSSSFTDWLINLNFAQQSYPWESGDNGKIKLHKGFSDAYKSIRFQIHDLISTWGNTHQICFCGHSQGGALAQIAAVDCQYNFAIEPILITFGQPKVGNLAYAKSVDRRIESYLRFVVKGDRVPSMPPGFVHSGKEIILQPKYKNSWYKYHFIETYRQAIDGKPVPRLHAKCRINRTHIGRINPRSKHGRMGVE